MVKIFIEGESKKVPESAFLHAILDNMGISEENYEFMHTGGYTNLLNDSLTNIELMRANTDAGGKNIVVFDADSEANNGGFLKRQEELLRGRDELSLDFDLFLWPDNQSDGDVEVLMERIARKDLYPEFFECFGKFENCISQRKKEGGAPFYTTPNRKGKLHTYFNSLPISNTKKKKFGSGEWRWSDPEIWDLNSESLVPLKEFLSKFLQ